MVKRLFISLIFMFILFFYGCGFAKGLTNSTPAPRSTWLVEFLEKPVCKPPCWNNITPALTTINEAEEILKANPAIKITDTNPVGIDWEFIPNGGIGYIEGQHKEKTVDIIHFEVNREQSLTLGDVIENYSDPTSIHFEQDMHNLKRCLFFVFYESYGLVFSNRDLPCKSSNKDGIYTAELAVSPDIVLNSISMLATGDRFSEYAGSVNPISWNGYGNYVREYRP